MRAVMAVVGLVTVFSCAGRREGEVEVVVARRDLPAGTLIAREHLTTTFLPVDAVPPAVLRTADLVIGRTTRESILTDELMREERLARPDAGTGVLATLPQGFAAVRLARPWPSSTARAEDVVEVVRVRGARVCVLGVATVLAGERADGTLENDPHVDEAFVALHLSVRADQAGAIATSPPAETDLWTRSPIEMAPVPETVPPCVSP